MARGGDARDGIDGACHEIDDLCHEIYDPMAHIGDRAAWDIAPSG